jgi:hypothetical protein
LLSKLQVFKSVIRFNIRSISLFLTCLISRKCSDYMWCVRRLNRLLRPNAVIAAGDADTSSDVVDGGGAVDENAPLSNLAGRDVGGAGGGFGRDRFDDDDDAAAAATATTTAGLIAVVVAGLPPPPPALSVSLSS